MTDIAAVTMTATIAGLVNLLIQGLFGMMFKRWVEQRDRLISNLSEEVKNLRDKEFGNLAGDLDRHVKENMDDFLHASEARKKIHEELTFVRTHFVHSAVCNTNHEKLEAVVGRIASIMVDMAKVSERTEATAKQLTTVSEQMIAFGRDLARLEGKLHEPG